MYMFEHPTSMIVCGPSGCGKTYFIAQLLNNIDTSFDTQINKVIWCYTEDNSINYIKNMTIQSNNPTLHEIEFIKGVPSSFENPNNDAILIVLDDLMMDAYNSQVSNLFTRSSHHRNISVILITQNIFHQSRHSRDISLNAKYIIVFKNPRDKIQFQHLARQIYPEKTQDLMIIYKECTDTPHGYLLIDLTQNQHEFLRFRSDIFNKQHIVCYCPQNLLNGKGITVKSINGQQAHVVCSPQSLA